VARLLGRNTVYKGHLGVIDVFRNMLFGASALLMAARTEFSAEFAL
jgi:hypothetical protein